MKNKKWFTYALGILFTLVILVAVGGASFRIGMMQNASFKGVEHPPFAQKFDGEQRSQTMQVNPQDGFGGFQDRQRNPHNQGFDNRGNDRRGGGMPFFSPIFGLIHLAILGLLLWGGYKLIQKSGWTLTRVAASPAPTPSPLGGETDSIEEKKEEA